MSRLASGLHRLRRSPWEVLWSALVSCGLVLFSQLAVAMVPRLFPSLSLLAMLPIAGFVFLSTIVVGRFWRRFIGVAASAPLFVLFNILFVWGVYIFVIRRDTSSLLDMLINAECALLLWGLYRIFSGDPGIVTYESSCLEEAGCKDFVDAICPSEVSMKNFHHSQGSGTVTAAKQVLGVMTTIALHLDRKIISSLWPF